MIVLVFGSDGFIGTHVCQLINKSYTVYTTSRKKPVSKNNHPIDLNDVQVVKELISIIKPDIIINCAGIVSAQGNVNLNAEFTNNILASVLGSGISVKNIILCSSASVYGTVDPKKLPIKETEKLKANFGYGLSKLKEEGVANLYKDKNHLPIVILRIFNPLGTGMNPRFLTSRILDQINEIKSGKRETIEISRLDAERDYISVKDVARAVKSVLDKHVSNQIYNVGSGKSYKNEYVVRVMLKYSHVKKNVRVVETLKNPEPFYATHADISRIFQDTGWKPKYDIEDVLKEIVYEESK